MKNIYLILALYFSFGNGGFSNITLVPDDRPTIQEAILYSIPGDTVLVREGTYNELINFNGKQVVVGSFFLTTGNSTYIDQTIISAPSPGPVVTFENGETELTSLIGFTIKNGTGKKEGFTFYGGGIYCNNAHPALEHLQIMDNVAGGLGGCGGGIYFRDSHAAVMDCLIEGNEASYGGGIRCDGSNVTIIKTWFRDNFAVNSGGGVMFHLCSAPRIQQCTFTGNSGIYGGAICCNESNPVIDRITSFYNTGGYGGTLNIEAMSNPKIINSILWKNSIDTTIVNEIFLGNGSNSLLVAYCDILGSDTSIHAFGSSTVNWMEGNIELYPEFNDPLTLDLTLPENSPCVNAGTALYIYNGDTLVSIKDFSGSSPDMGAYEYLQPVAISQLRNSGNGLDCQVLAGNSIFEKIIRFKLPQNGQIYLSIYDLRGREMVLLADRFLPAGEHRFSWNHSTFPTGIYIVRLITPHCGSSKQLLVH